MDAASAVAKRTWPRHANSLIGVRILLRAQAPDRVLLHDILWTTLLVEIFKMAPVGSAKVLCKDNPHPSCVQFMMSPRACEAMMGGNE